MSVPLGSSQILMSKNLGYDNHVVNDLPIFPSFDRLKFPTSRHFNRIISNNRDQ
jgi:hypothetical protein